MGCPRDKCTMLLLMCARIQAGRGRVRAPEELDEMEASGCLQCQSLAAVTSNAIHRLAVLISVCKEFDCDQRIASLKLGGHSSACVQPRSCDSAHLNTAQYTASIIRYTLHTIHRPEQTSNMADPRVVTALASAAALLAGSLAVWLHTRRHDDPQLPPGVDACTMQTGLPTLYAQPRGYTPSCGATHTVTATMASASSHGTPSATRWSSPTAQPTPKPPCSTSCGLGGGRGWPSSWSQHALTSLPCRRWTRHGGKTFWMRWHRMGIKGCYSLGKRTRCFRSASRFCTIPSACGSCGRTHAAGRTLQRFSSCMGVSGCERVLTDGVD